MIMVAGCIPVGDRNPPDRPTSAPASPSTGTDSPTPAASSDVSTPPRPSPATATRNPSEDKAALRRLCRSHCEGLQDAQAAQDSCDYEEPGDCYRPVAIALGRVTELMDDPDSTAVADYLAIDLVVDNGRYFQRNCRRPKATGPPFDPSCPTAYNALGVGLAQIESMLRI